MGVVENQSKQSLKELSLNGSTLPSSGVTRGIAMGFLGMAINAGLASKSPGALLMDGVPDQSSRDLASLYSGKSVYLFTNYTTSTGAQGTGKASGLRLDDYNILTARHNVVSTSVSIDSITVGTGLNYNSAPGNVSTTPSSNIKIYPDANADLALITLTNPLPGPSVSFGNALPGEVVYSVGYGQWGWQSAGLSPRDGNARAWAARVQNPDEPFMNYTAFTYDNVGLAVHGRGASGDSGGPVFNNAGDLVGITSAGTTFSTIYIDINNPSLSSWISANAVVPEPSSLGLMGLAGASLLRRQRRQVS